MGSIVDKLSPEALEYYREYSRQKAREWREKNKDHLEQKRVDYWERKAKEAKQTK